jgi:hypothetical protein
MLTLPTSQLHHPFANEAIFYLDDFGIKESCGFFSGIANTINGDCIGVMTSHDDRRPGDDHLFTRNWKTGFLHVKRQLFLFGRSWGGIL